MPSDPSTTDRSEAVEVLAASAETVAQMLGISERSIWKLLSSGRLPKPIAFGRAKRWRLAELRAWLDAGAPSRDVWEAMRIDT